MGLVDEIRRREMRYMETGTCGACGFQRLHLSMEPAEIGLGNRTMKDAIRACSGVSAAAHRTDGACMAGIDRAVLAVMPATRSRSLESAKVPARSVIPVEIPCAPALRALRSSADSLQFLIRGRPSVSVSKHGPAIAPCPQSGMKLMGSPLASTRASHSPNCRSQPLPNSKSLLERGKVLPFRQGPCPAAVSAGKVVTPGEENVHP
jgi:hypothetical protein